MVHDVVVRDVVEEKATHPAQEVAVDCRRRAALVVPFRLAIVGQFRVSVVQIRDHDEPAGTAVVERCVREDTPTHQWVTSSHGMP